RPKGALDEPPTAHWSNTAISPTSLVHAAAMARRRDVVRVRLSGPGAVPLASCGGGAALRDRRRRRAALQRGPGDGAVARLTTDDAAALAATPGARADPARPGLSHADRALDRWIEQRDPRLLRFPHGLRQP